MGSLPETYNDSFFFAGGGGGGDGGGGGRTRVEGKI